MFDRYHHQATWRVVGCFYGRDAALKRSRLDEAIQRIRWEGRLCFTRFGVAQTVYGPFVLMGSSIGSQFCGNTTTSGFSCAKVSKGPAAGLYVHAHLQETENHSWRDFQNRRGVRDWSCVEESIWRRGHGFLWRCFHTKHHFSSRTTETPSGLLAVHLFGCVDRNIQVGAMPLKIAAVTDNLADEHLIRRGLTTKWPLCLDFMQLTQTLMKAGVLIQLAWRPRDENALADALTNGDYSEVSLAKRISCNWDDFDFTLIWTLWEERETYWDREAFKANSKLVQLGNFEKSNW